MWWRRRSKEKAKERLKLVLAYDRARLSPWMVESLKQDPVSYTHLTLPTKA